MKHLIRFLVFLLVVVSVFTAFKTEILFWAEETYYSYKEGDVNQADGRSVWNDFKNDAYWDGKTFLLDKYLESLGFIPAIRQQDEHFTVWRCGARRFSINDENDGMIGIVGDEWNDLTTKNNYVVNGHYVEYDGKIIKDVDEETIFYFISSLINLRKNDNLREVTDGVRADVDKYHTDGEALL